MQVLPCVRERRHQVEKTGPFLLTLIASALIFDQDT